MVWSCRTWAPSQPGPSPGTAQRGRWLAEAPAYAGHIPGQQETGAGTRHGDEWVVSEARQGTGLRRASLTGSSDLPLGWRGSCQEMQMPLLKGCLWSDTQHCGLVQRRGSPQVTIHYHSSPKFVHLRGPVLSPQAETLPRTRVRTPTSAQALRLRNQPGELGETQCRGARKPQSSWARGQLSRVRVCCYLFHKPKDP